MFSYLTALKWGGCSFAKFLSVHHNGVRCFYACF
nr:MAG TPA: hypothetical protein [Caudoviricetes sp.]